MVRANNGKEELHEIPMYSEGNHDSILTLLYLTGKRNYTKLDNKDIKPNEKSLKNTGDTRLRIEWE